MTNVLIGNTKEQDTETQCPGKDEDKELYNYKPRTLITA